MAAWLGCLALDGDGEVLPLRTLHVWKSNRAPAAPFAAITQWRFASLLARLFSRVECVVVAAPPISGAAETQILSAAADDVLLIIDTAASRLRDAAVSIRLGEGVDAKLFGAVLIEAATGDIDDLELSLANPHRAVQ